MHELLQCHGVNFLILSQNFLVGYCPYYVCHELQIGESGLIIIPMTAMFNILDHGSIIF